MGFNEKQKGQILRRRVRVFMFVLIMDGVFVEDWTEIIFTRIQYV